LWLKNLDFGAMAAMTFHGSSSYRCADRDRKIQYLERDGLLAYSGKNIDTNFRVCHMIGISLALVPFVF
jgi:hypothetical protein